MPYGLTDLGFGLRNPSPWRAGANENTTITFSHDVQVEGKPIAAGTYGLHLVVEESGPWTAIFSNNSTAWGSYFYEEGDDALRVEVTPEDGEFHEWLTYEFTDRQPNSTTVAMMWENKKVPIKIEVPNVNDLYVANFRKELQSSPGFTWQSWNAAANFCVNNDINLEEALSWAEQAISAPFIGQANFTTLQTKASVLSKLDRADDAAATMKLAMEHPTATAFQIHAYGRQLITQGKKDEALEVFEYNHKRFEGAWPTNVGMARGLSAKGDYKEALNYAKLAHDEAPDNLNKTSMETAIAKLEKGEDIN